MLEGILWIFICFLSFIGLLSLVERGERLLRPNFQHPFLLLLPLQGHVDNVEGLLRETLSVLEGQKDHISGQLLIVDCGMDWETLTICKFFCEDAYWANLVEKEQFCDIIEKQMEQML